MTHTQHYRKHNIDYPNDHIDKKFKDPEFLREYHFKDSYKASPHKTTEEKILYKTKDLPDTIKGLFKDSNLLQNKMNAVWILTSLKIDYWLLNNIWVGFMSYMNSILKE